MKRLRLACEAYLHRLGRLQPVRLGYSDAHPVTQEDNQFLVQQLRATSKANKTMIGLMTTILCVSYGPGAWLMFHHVTSPGTIGSVLGGTFVALFLIVARLRQLWRETSFIEIVSTTVDELPPEQVAQVVELLYWAFMRNTSRPTTRELEAWQDSEPDVATASDVATDTQLVSWETFCRELPRLLQDAPGQWVAFHSERQMALGTSKREVYEQLVQIGCPLEEVIVRRIEALGPPVDLRRFRGASMN